MVQQVKLALVREREPAMLERKRWNEIAKRSEGGSGVGWGVEEEEGEEEERGEFELCTSGSDRDRRDLAGVPCRFSCDLRVGAGGEVLIEGPPGEAVEGAGAGAVCRTGDAAMLAARPDTWTGWGAVCTKLWAVGNVGIGFVPRRTWVVS